MKKHCFRAFALLAGAVVLGRVAISALYLAIWLACALAAPTYGATVPVPHIPF